MADNIHVPPGKVNKLIGLFETGEPAKPPTYLRRNSQRSSFLRQFSSEQLVQKIRPASQELPAKQEEKLAEVEQITILEKSSPVAQEQTREYADPPIQEVSHKIEEEPEQTQDVQQLTEPVMEALQISSKIEIPSSSESFKATDEAHLIKNALEKKDPDFPLIIQLLTRRKSQERLRICDVYYEIFGKTLSAVFRSRLEGHLKLLMLALVSSPYDYIAKEINRSMKGLGTDEDTLMELICTQDENSLRKICDQYLLLFKCELKDAVKDDTSGSFRQVLCALLTFPRNNDGCDPKDFAEQLSEESKSSNDISKEFLSDILTSYNQVFLKKMFSHFKTKSGRNFLDLLEQVFSGDTLKALTIIYKFSLNPCIYFAEKLHEAMEGIGMKELSVIRILVSRCEIDLNLISKEYWIKYNITLKKCIEKNSSGYLAMALIALLESSLPSGYTETSTDINDGQIQSLSFSDKLTKEKEFHTIEIDATIEEVYEHKPKQNMEIEQTQEICGKNRGHQEVTPENTISEIQIEEEYDPPSQQQNPCLNGQVQQNKNDHQPKNGEISTNITIDQLIISDQDSEAKSCETFIHKNKPQQMESSEPQREDTSIPSVYEAQEKPKRTPVVDDQIQQIKEHCEEEEALHVKRIVVDLEYDLPEHFLEEKNVPTVIYATEFDDISVDQQVQDLSTSLDGLKSDLDALIFIICKRNYLQRHQLATAYKACTGKDLNAVIKKETVGYLEDTLTSLLCPRKIFMAMCLNKALRAFHVKEDVIIEILCPLTTGELRDLAEAYTSCFGHDIIQDARKNLTGSFRDFILILLANERKDAPLETVGSIVHKLCAHKFPQEEKKKLVEESMQLCSYRFLYHLFKVYETQTGSKFLDLITTVSSGLVGQILIAIYQCVVDRHGFYAGVLRLAMRGIGTDESALIRVIVGRSETDLENIKKEFYKKYVKNLEENIEDETSGYFCKALVSLIEGNRGIIVKSPLRSQNSLVIHEDIDSPTQEKAVAPVIEAQEQIVAQSNISRKLEVITVQKKTEIKKKIDLKNIDIKLPIELPPHLQGKQRCPTIEPAKECSPDKDAEILYKAMRGIGNDEKTIVDLITKRSRDQCQEIILSFKRIYDKDLVCELKKELTGDLEDIIIEYMSPPLSYLVETLHEAINKRKGIDTVAEILFYSDQEILKNIRHAYKNVFEKDLQKVIKEVYEEDVGELLSESLDLKICEDEYLPQKIAARIGEDGCVSDRSLYIISQYNSKESLFKIFHCYEKIVGETFVQSVYSQTKETSIKVILSALYDSVVNPSSYFSKKLYKALSGLGTDEKDLNRIIVSRCELDLQNIIEEYRELYGKSLHDCVQSDTSGSYRRALLSILEGNIGYLCTYDTRQTESEEILQQKTEAKSMLKKQQVTFSASDLYENIVAEQKSEEVYKEAEKSKDQKTEIQKIPPPEYDKRPLYLRGSEGTPSMHPYPCFDASVDVCVLRKATKGLLTDEKTVIELLTNRDCHQRHLILEAYHKEHGKALIPKIRKKFCASSHLILSSLLTPRIAFLSKELHGSMKGLGTDEETLAEILCLCPPNDLRVIKDSYHIISDKPLKDQIVGDTSGKFKDILLKLLAGQREDPQDCSPEDEARELLSKDSKGKLKISANDIQEVLVNYRHAYLYDLFYYVKQISGISFNELITKHTSGDVKMVLLTIYHSITNRYGFFATRLNSALKGRVNERTVTRILIWRSEIDLENIKQEFQKMFGRTLKAAIEEATSGGVRKTFLSLIELKKTLSEAKK